MPVNDLYVLPGSYKSLMCIMAAKGTDTKVQLCPVQFGNVSEDYLKINPRGKSPSLVTADGPLTEATAICRHFARVSGKMMGENAYENAKVDEWVDHVNTEYFHLFGAFVYQYLGLEFPGLDFRPSSVFKGWAQFKNHLKHAEKLLEGRTTCVGNSYTIADIALVAAVQMPFFVASNEKDRKEFPNLMKW